MGVVLARGDAFDRYDVLVWAHPTKLRTGIVFYALVGAKVVDLGLNLAVVGLERIVLGFELLKRARFVVEVLARRVQHDGREDERGNAHHAAHAPSGNRAAERNRQAHAAALGAFLFGHASTFAMGGSHAHVVDRRAASLRLLALSCRTLARTDRAVELAIGFGRAELLAGACQEAFLGGTTALPIMLGGMGRIVAASALAFLETAAATSVVRLTESGATMTRSSPAPTWLMGLMVQRSMGTLVETAMVRLSDRRATAVGRRITLAGIMRASTLTARGSTTERAAFAFAQSSGVAIVFAARGR